jgi:hypothetical protein
MKKIIVLVGILFCIGISNAQVKKTIKKNIEKRELIKVKGKENLIFNSIQQAGFAQIVELAKPYYEKGMNLEKFIASTGENSDKMNKIDMNLMKEIHFVLQKNLSTEEVLKRPLPISIKEIFSSNPTFPNQPKNEKDDCKFFCKVKKIAKKIRDTIDELIIIITIWE